MAPLRFAVLGRGPMAARMRALIGDVPFDEAEAVYIASRNRDHGAQSIAALEAGRAVLCEKPCAMSAAEAEKIISISKRTGLPYMEAVTTPFLPAVAAALDAVDSGRIGAPTHLTASFGYPVDRARHPRLFEGDGGVLADRAVYPLMLALIAMGPVRASHAVVDRDADGVDIAARFSLDHMAGGRSELAVSLTGRLDNSLRIEGDRDSVEIVPPLLLAQRIAFGRPAALRRWRQLRQNAVVRRAGEAAARIIGGWHPYGASVYRPQIAHFEKLVRAGHAESPVITHDRMLAVVHLVEEARRS